MHSGENVHVHLFRNLNIFMWKLNIYIYIHMCAGDP